MDVKDVWLHLNSAIAEDAGDTRHQVLGYTTKYCISSNFIICLSCFFFQKVLLALVPR